MKSALIIDDDYDIREILTALLESAGFHVETMNDGIKALSLQKRYDVILLDMKMPVFDGERLADHWQLTEPGLLSHVIVLTGYSQLTRGRALPAFASVQKPFDNVELLRVVNACVEQRSLDVVSL